MRKETRTKLFIHNHYNQIEYMKYTNSILYDANYKYFEEWNKRNNPQITQINAMLLDLDKKFYEHDEDNFSRDTEGKFIFKDGMTKEAYDKEFNELLDHPAVVYL